MGLFSNIGFGGLTTFVSLYAPSRHVQPILAYSLVFSGALLIFRPLAGRLYDRRGAAIYTAFDLGIGIGATGLGLLVGRFGYPSIYLASAILTLVALGICAVSFKRTPGPAAKGPAHSQAIPSPSRSSWVRYPGSPR